jgi:hypothetical protein
MLRMVMLATVCQQGLHRENRIFVRLCRFDSSWPSAGEKAERGRPRLRLAIGALSPQPRTPRRRGLGCASRRSQRGFLRRRSMLSSPDQQPDLSAGDYNLEDTARRMENGVQDNSL